MMKLYTKHVLLLCLLIGLGSIDVAAKRRVPFGKTEYTKTIKKKFKLTADGDVSIANKYGNVNLKTWNQNEVKIDITITANASSEAIADNIFERIIIEFANRSDFVGAQTVIESQKSNWWGGKDKGDFTIDYDVSIPSRANLQLSNKYGDAEIEAIGGDASINVKYGNFNLHSVDSDAEIELGYGNGTIGEVRKASIDLMYGKLKLKQAKHLYIESMYSKLYVDKADKIKSNSKYDTYNLGELIEFSNQGKHDHFDIEGVSFVSIYSKYSDLKIETLYKKGEFEMKHGGVKINNLKKGFDLVSFDCSYTDCKIYMDDHVDFQLDARVEYASVRYPGGMNVSYEKQKDSDHEVTGHRGSSSAGTIKARLKHGGLKLK